MKKPLLIIFLILLIDQIIKIYVKTHFDFQLHNEYRLTDWAFIRFTENPGMAYGMEFGGRFGKIFLSVFRFFAIAGIGYYLWSLTRKNEDKFYIICIALICAGAMGNLIDSAFYGIIFSDSNYEIARFMPEEGGYATFLHGSVVDMFYFPITKGHFPSWFPFWGTEGFTFFSPIFNFADASISIGVALIIIFQKRFFGKKEEPVSLVEEPTTENPEPKPDTTDL